MSRSAKTEESRPIRERMAEAFDLPKEALFDTVLISCIGNRELTVENYKSILEYSDRCIRIQASPRPIKISGQHLELRSISRELLYIVGQIHSVESDSPKERQNRYATD